MFRRIGFDIKQIGEMCFDLLNSGTNLLYLSLANLQKGFRADFGIRASTGQTHEEVWTLSLDLDLNFHEKESDGGLFTFLFFSLHYTFEKNRRKMSSGPDLYTSFRGDNHGRVVPTNSVPVGGFLEGISREYAPYDFSPFGSIAQQSGAVTEMSKFQQAATIQPLDPMASSRFSRVPGYLSQ